MFDGCTQCDQILLNFATLATFFTVHLVFLQNFDLFANFDMHYVKLYLINGQIL